MQFALNIRIGQSNSRWTTVDDDSDTTSVRGTISTGGNAPTILIAPLPQPTTGIEIGIYDDSVDSGYSFLNRGNIVGTSINPDVNVTTFSIIGASADLQTVFDGGIFNGGAISAAATTNTRAASVTATALYIGDNTVICGFGSTSTSCASGLVDAGRVD